MPFLTTRRLNARVTTGLISTAVIGLLGAAVPVEAAQRFAAPASGRIAGDCPRSTPCRFDHAAGGATSGDEVVVLPGEHRVSATVRVTGTGIDVHGADGESRPRIVGTGSGNLMELAGGSGAPLRLRHLQLVHAAPSAWVVHTVDGSVELSRLVVEARADSMHALELAGGTGEVLARDSVVRMVGPIGAAIVARAADVELRNVTAVAADDGSTGLRVRGDCVPDAIPLNQCGPGSHAGVTTARNVIARGARDVVVTGDFGLAGTVRLGHSNFGSVLQREGGTSVDEGGNQTARPTFSDEAGGDLHQAAGSPTLDAGTADRLGATDVDGEARIQGPEPDIGADERPFASVPPGGGGGGGGGATDPGVGAGGSAPPSAPGDRTPPPAGSREPDGPSAPPVAGLPQLLVETLGRRAKATPRLCAAGRACPKTTAPRLTPSLAACLRPRLIARAGPSATAVQVRRLRGGRRVDRLLSATPAGRFRLALPRLRSQVERFTIRVRYAGGRTGEATLTLRRTRRGC